MSVVTPKMIFDDLTFDWNTYLQDHLENPGIVVSKLHPLFGWRLAMLMAELTQKGLASTTPGQGTYQIYSGVRTYEHQKGLWNKICRIQKRCRMVANPDRKRGLDFEGISRQGSNHQTATMPQPWGAAVGYAIDIYNLRKTKGMNAAQLDEAWRPLHELMNKYGIDDVLDGKQGRPRERWHLQPMNSQGWYGGAMAWPTQPGIIRPIIRGFVGGDVAVCQTQLGKILGLKVVPRNHPGPTPAGAIRADGHAGSGTEMHTVNAEKKMGVQPDGVWSRSDQDKYNELVSKPVVKPAPAPPVDKPTKSPTADDTRITVPKGVLTRAERHTAMALSEIREALGSH